MRKEVLAYINNTLSELIPYCFITWNKKVQYPYWIGEYTEVEPMDEDGLEESTFILTGTTKGTWLELEQAKETIRQTFPQISGLRATLDDNSGVAIFYSDAFPVPTGQDDLKRMQINLTVKHFTVTE